VTKWDFHSCKHQLPCENRVSSHKLSVASVDQETAVLYPSLCLIFSFWCFRYQAGCTATDSSNSCHFISQVFQGNRQCRLWQLCKLLFYQLFFSFCKEVNLVHASIMSIYNSNEGPDTFVKAFSDALWWQFTGVMLVWLPLFQRNILPSSLILSVITHRICIYLFGLLIDYHEWKFCLDQILSIMNNFSLGYAVCASVHARDISVFRSITLGGGRHRPAYVCSLLLQQLSTWRAKWRMTHWKLEMSSMSPTTHFTEGQLLWN